MKRCGVKKNVALGARMVISLAEHNATDAHFDRGSGKPPMGRAFFNTRPPKLRGEPEASEETMTMALSFRNVVGLFGKGRKYDTRSRGLAARWEFRPVLESLEERAAPSAMALGAVHAAPVAAACSQDHKEAIKVEYGKELPGDSAHKADDKGETKVEQRTEKTDNSTDKGSLDNSRSRSQDPSSSDSSSTSAIDQVFSSSNSQDLKDS
jgi:hypothetical protein